MELQNYGKPFHNLQKEMNLVINISLINTFYATMHQKANQVPGYYSIKKLFSKVFSNLKFFRGFKGILNIFTSHYYIPT
jgi:hypothetical protein